MPVHNVNQRARVAELAAEIGWKPREYTSVKSDHKSHTIYCVEFIHPNSDHTITVEYSSMDKIVSATRDKELPYARTVHRATDVYKWLRDVRRAEPAEQVFEVHDYGEYITFSKPNDEYSTVTLHRYSHPRVANWFRLTHKDMGQLTIDIGKDRPMSETEEIRKLAIHVGLAVAKFNFDDKEL